MKKRNKIITTLLLTTLLFTSTITGCGSETIVAVNVENNEELHSDIFGKNALIKIGNGLWYDSTTRIVYLMFSCVEEGYISPYYAPNGLPYRYNPETNTFEEINNMNKGEYNYGHKRSRKKNERL